MTKEELLVQLDDDQRAAVTAPLGNVLCIANAGSGKTRVLTYRIAHCLMNGVPESSIMMLTFTNKAAGEMMERIKTLIGHNQLALTGGTFHSIACRFLRRWASVLDIDPHFTILPESDALGLMDMCCKEYRKQNNLDKESFPVEASVVMAVYSYSRNTMMPFEEARKLFDVLDVDSVVKIEKKIIAAYEKGKRGRNALDFDDLLVLFNDLLGHPHAAEWFHTHYPNIFVDEYQDINKLQDSIIHRLADQVNCVTAVGDEAQCIYGFRGSEVDFIRSFPKDYPGASVYSIRNNYRSVSGIVNLAVNVINQSAYNKEHPKEMFAAIGAGGDPIIKTINTKEDQAKTIALTISHAHKKGIPYSEMAILVRSRFCAREIELALTRAGIPCNMECGTKFFEMPHIKPIVYFLRLLNNHKDDIAFRNIVGTVFGIGEKTTDKIYDKFSANGYEFAQLYGIAVSKRSEVEFGNLAKALVVAAKKGTLLEQVDVFIKYSYDAYIHRAFKDDYYGRVSDVDQFRKEIKAFDTIQDFLENVALDDLGVGTGKTKDKVTLTTVHRSKGLEWDTVYLPFINEGYFPSYKSQTDEAIEEERRLLYVAITRARKRLALISILNDERGECEMSSLLKQARNATSRAA